MQLAQPIWIIAGLLFCIGLYLFSIHLDRKRNRTLQSFAAKNLLHKLTRNVSSGKRALKLMLMLSAIMFCFIALARPQYGHRWIDVKRKGIDILFAIDTSNSMLAQDIRPSRLERSKYAILDFVSQLDGDRVGLMPFAGSAFLMCPLTIDYSAFERTLQAVDTSVIPEQGTNLAHAIEYAESVLQNDANHKLLIIITDGENLQGDSLQAARQAAEKDMTIFTVGVGTREGELIPSPAKEGGGFVKDESGQFVISRLDENSLRRIAETTGGLYAPLGNRGQGLETIYRQKLVLIPKEELAEKRHKIPIERFPWFLGVALILLVFEFLLGGRKMTGLLFRLPRKLGGGPMVVVLLAQALSFAHPSLSSASPGEVAFNKKDFTGASQYYEKMLEKKPDDALLNYNYGTAAYKNKLYDEAIAAFNKALRSNDLSIQEKAYFNRGNAQFKKGEKILQTDPQKAISHWQDSLTSYQGALQLHPGNERARFNHDMVKKKLEKLKKQEQQEKRQNSDQPQQETNNSKKNTKGQDQETRKKNDTSAQKQKSDKQEQQSSGKDSKKQKTTAGKHENDKKQPQPRTKEDAKPGRQVRQQQDGQQQQNGKMSRQEAVQLLKEMKNEEGMLNFVPRSNEETPQKNRKNW